MAQDLSSVKSNVASQISNISGQLIQLYNNLIQLDQTYFAFGLNSGGANQYVQTDLVGSNAFLTPTVISNTISVFQSITTALGAGQMTDLQLTVSSPVL